MTLGYNYREFATLFVDDEEQARKYFRMAFEGDFQVLTAASVEDAWALLQAGEPPVGLVVADQRMPHETGNELLARVRRTNPEIVRILTTAHGDLDTVIDAVNTGAIFKYVVKPWDVRELRGTLLRAMEYFLLRRERDILLEEKLSALQQLLVADRIRSLAVLAQGLSTHVRDTMIALQAYVTLAREQACSAPMPWSVRAEDYWCNVEAEVEEANAHLLRIVGGVAEATVERSYEFNDEVALPELAGSAWAAEMSGQNCTLRVDVADGLPKLRCCRAMLERLFGSMYRQMLRGARARDTDGPALVRVIARDRVRAWGADGVAIDVVGEGWTWDDLPLSALFMPLGGLDDDEHPDLLAAFFIAYHHGGTIELHRGTSARVGFRLMLPFEPERAVRPAFDADAAEELFARLPHWKALERDA